MSNFQSESPASQVYMITGDRGSGKTVFLTHIAQELQKDPQWIVLELNPTIDLQKGFAAALYAQPELSHRFIEAKIDLSLFGIGISLQKAPVISDYDTALDRMLAVVQKQKKKVLVLIDEASNTRQMQIFAASFQILLRKEYPLFLLLTGLYENIYELQNTENLTFLYRAPKVQMEPLQYASVCANYRSALSVSEEQSEEMASVVRGYPYAFQVLGHLYWKQQPKEVQELLPLFDQYLSEYVYDKIWEELSETDRKVLRAVCESQTQVVKDIREQLQMPSNQFSVYKERLKKKGLIVCSTRGRVAPALPRMVEFVHMRGLAEQ